MITIPQNTLYSLEARVTDTKGNSIDNLDVEYLLTKVFDSNNFILSGLMTSIGKGVYKVDINLSEVGQYRVLYNLEDYYIDAIETLIVEELSLSQITILLTNSQTLLAEIARISEALNLTPKSVSYSKQYTTLIKRDEKIFSNLYTKTIVAGWSLVRIEGNSFYFEK